MVVEEKEPVFLPPPQKAVGLSQLSQAPPFFHWEREWCECVDACRQETGGILIVKKEKESIGIAGLAMSYSIQFSS